MLENCCYALPPPPPPPPPSPSLSATTSTSSPLSSAHRFRQPSLSPSPASSSSISAPAATTTRTTCRKEMSDVQSTWAVAPTAFFSETSGSETQAGNLRESTKPSHGPDLGGDSSVSVLATASRPFGATLSVTAAKQSSGAANGGYGPRERSTDSHGSHCRAKDDGGGSRVTASSGTSSGMSTEGSSSLTDGRTTPSSSSPSPGTVHHQQQKRPPPPQLPKNAVELIAWAITECVSTTPTLCQIATRIRANVAAYREQELGVVMKLVQHHLDTNNPEYFLPVLMAPAGTRGRPPGLNKWALNHQTVVVSKDGSISRRRLHRSSSATSSYVSKHAAGPSPYLPVPTPNSPSPKLMLQALQSPPDGAHHRPCYGQLQAYPGTPPPGAAYLSSGPLPSSTVSGPIVTLYGTSTGSDGLIYSHASQGYPGSGSGSASLSRAGAYGAGPGPLSAYRGGPYPGHSGAFSLGGGGTFSLNPNPGVFGAFGLGSAAYGVQSSTSYNHAGGYGLSAAPSSGVSASAFGLDPALYGGVSDGSYTIRTGSYEVNRSYDWTPGGAFDLTFATGAAGVQGAGYPQPGGVAYQCSL